MKKNMLAVTAAALAISLLSSTAALAAGWEKVSGDWFYRQEDGTVVKDTWIQTEGGVYWMRNDGVMATNQWVGYENAWYYVGADGNVLKNQLLTLNNSDLYWLHEDGKMASDEWVQTQDGKWYYFQSNGQALKKGWKQIDGDWYYFLNSGVMAADALVPGGYRVGADGKWIQ